MMTGQSPNETLDIEFQTDRQKEYYDNYYEEIAAKARQLLPGIEASSICKRVFSNVFEAGHEQKDRISFEILLYVTLHEVCNSSY